MRARLSPAVARPRPPRQARRRLPPRPPADSPVRPRRWCVGEVQPAWPHRPLCRLRWATGFGARSTARRLRRLKRPRPCLRLPPSSPASFSRTSCSSLCSRSCHSLAASSRSGISTRKAIPPYRLGIVNSAHDRQLVIFLNRWADRATNRGTPRHAPLAAADETDPAVGHVRRGARAQHDGAQKPGVAHESKYLGSRLNSGRLRLGDRGFCPSNLTLVTAGA